jgi:hypothetical protein
MHKTTLLLLILMATAGCPKPETGIELSEVLVN